MVGVGIENSIKEINRTYTKVEKKVKKVAKKVGKKIKKIFG